MPVDSAQDGLFCEAKPRLYKEAVDLQEVAAASPRLPSVCTLLASLPACSYPKLHVSLEFAKCPPLVTHTRSLICM